MKAFIISFLFGLIMLQLCPAQHIHHSVSVDIMTTAVNRSTMDSVQLKVSIPDDIHLSELTFPISKEESGKIFITGTPYDSVRVQIPVDVSVFNQYGERAELRNFQLMYGTSEDMSAMEVVSPSGCVTVQIPETARIHIRLGGTLASEINLRGMYTGSIRFDCRREE